MGKKGKKGGEGGGGGKKLQETEGTEVASQPQQQQRQQHPQPSQSAPDDFPHLGESGRKKNKRKGQQTYHSQEEGEPSSGQQHVTPRPPLQQYQQGTSQQGPQQQQHPQHSQQQHPPQQQQRPQDPQQQQHPQDPQQQQHPQQKQQHRPQQQQRPQQQHQPYQQQHPPQQQQRPSHSQQQQRPQQQQRRQQQQRPQQQQQPSQQQQRPQQQHQPYQQQHPPQQQQRPSHSQQQPRPQQQQRRQQQQRPQDPQQQQPPQQQQRPQQQQQVMGASKPAPHPAGPPGLATEEPQQGQQSAQQHLPTIPDQPQHVVLAPQPVVSQQKQITPQNIQQVTEKTKDLNVRNAFLLPKRLARPADPKKGREIIVETNHLALNIKNQNMIIHHYDVSVVPERPYRIYRKALAEVQKICYPKRFPAFDGKKNLYSYPELPLKSPELVQTVSIYDSERDQTKEVTVTIKHAATVNVSPIWDYLRSGSSTNPPQDAIQALDIVLRQPAANRFVTVGRSFFTPPSGRVINLGDGLDLWYGVFQSAIMGWKPYLNIDVAHKGFPTPDSCVEALSKFCNCSLGDLKDSRFKLMGYQKENFYNYIKNLKIIYEIPQRGIKRTYKVTGLSDSPRENRFDVVNRDTQAKSNTTVEKYFFNQYRYVLQYPLLPCLTVGSIDKPLSLPIELCRIQEGQVTMKKMNDIQTRNMVKEAAVDTERRKFKIVKAMEQINFNVDPCLKEFGLSVADNFTKVKARILNAPTVTYRESQPVTVTQGVWRNQKFLQGADLLTWRILNTNKRIDETTLRDLGKGLIQHGMTCGMKISENYSIVTKENVRDIEYYFKKCQQDQVKLVIVILPDRGVTYANVKKLAELQIGILTQCLKTITVLKRLSPATFVNILQKVNAKLNGVNHNITPSYWPEFFQKPVIVVGADVTHPSPDQINVPSIAAVAASHDPKAFKYNMIWKLQPPREETILDLKNIMKEQLLKFYSVTRQKPLAILFYRDGVSEGYFKKILDVELNAIRAACTSLEPDYKPPITFLVVQKRHHTRFFPNKKDADGRNKNVPAGTVVDTEITHPTELDFYLVSHASIQGTARPTKYHLLWDDSNMSEQDLEEITYYLCHLFTRCTRSVSYPAPTYYAHLAAFRARSYTELERIHLDQLDQEQNRRQVRDVIKNLNPMYFV